MSQQKRYEFTGELYLGPRSSHYIDFPFDAEEAFGTKKQVKVKVWFDGYPERKSLLPKGGGKHWLTVGGHVCQAIGKGDGDKVAVVVEFDDEPRIVTLPEELEWLLDNEPEIREVFMNQGYSNRKFFCDWIVQAKDPGTRVNRINHIFDWLRRHSTGKKVSPFQSEGDSTPGSNASR